MQLSQEQINALCYQPYWYNVGMEEKILLTSILEQFIEQNKDDVSLVAEDAKHLLEIFKSPIFKKYKDVIHCGVSH
jgi:hypothetical protein